MHDLFLWTAGTGAIAVAVIHGVLGETKSLPAQRSSRRDCVH
jgi:hypothetical protein